MAAVSLGADLGIESADALKTRLAHHLDAAEPVQLDAGAVSRVHSASVQVLCAFVRDRARSGQTTTLDPVAPELQAALRTLGLDNALRMEPHDP